jgi:hypothetical protein
MIHVFIVDRTNAMHTLNPIRNLVILALLGSLTGTIMTSSLQKLSMAFGKMIPAHATRGFTGPPTPIQQQYFSGWQRLKSKSEAQIRANETSILKIKKQKLGAGRAFCAMYDKRMAELERRNVALRGKLNDYAGDRGDAFTEAR